jgi:hypothetical protein
MASGWHFQDDATPTPGEVEAMVAVLEGRHGVLAAEVAEFFSTLHSLKGDAGRSWAWAGWPSWCAAGSRRAWLSPPPEDRVLKGLQGITAARPSGQSHAALWLNTRAADLATCAA